MIHVALDTSAIDNNKSINDANYKALQRLIHANEITIYIPYIVKKEIESQESEYYLTRYRELKKSLKQFNSVQKPPELYKKFNDIKNEVIQIEGTIELDAERFSNAWVNGLNSKIWPLNTTQSLSAWDAYFNGTAPLTLKKVKDDIPDSFICSAIKEIKETFTNLTVLAKDSKVYNTFQNMPNIEIHKTIADFIKSEKIQKILEELDTITAEELEIITGKSIVQGKLTNLADFIKEYEATTSLMESFLESQIGEKILYANIYDLPLSNDIDGEASINSYNNGENIKIDLDNPIHYGDNQIGYNFELEVEVLVDYFVNKSDYYSEFYADQNLTSNISVVEDWNDHVLHAESDINIKVTGIVSITIDTSNVDFSEIAKCDPDELDDHLFDLYNESTVKIESIGEIEAI